MNRYLLLLIGLLLFMVSVIALPAGKMLCLRGGAWTTGLALEIKISSVLLFVTTLLAGFLCVLFSIVGESE